MKSQIVVIGSLNMDLVIRMNRFPAPGETITGSDFSTFHGGKGANQAYAAARLGGRVRMIGRTGNDAYAQELKQNLAAVGVDVSAIRQDSETSSGIACISIDGSGQNRIVVIPGANGTFDVRRLEEWQELIRSARVVLLQFEIPMETVLQAARFARAGGALIILDPAPAREVPEELLQLADYITPNETELLALAGGSGAPGGSGDLNHIRMMAQSLVKQGARNVLVKMGALGALLVSGDGREQFWEAVPVEVVDTTAAGDSFNAAFAVALAGGKSEAEAGEFAAAAAACSVTGRGAQASMPTGEEVQRLLSQHRKPS